MASRNALPISPGKDASARAPGNRSAHSSLWAANVATALGSVPAAPGVLASPHPANWMTPLHGAARSAATALAVTVTAPSSRALARNSSASRLRPTPGSPSMNTRLGVLLRRQEDHALVSRCSCAPRPTSGARRVSAPTLSPALSGHCHWRSLRIRSASSRVTPSGSASSAVNPCAKASNCARAPARSPAMAMLDITT